MWQHKIHIETLNRGDIIFLFFFCSLTPGLAPVSIMCLSFAAVFPLSKKRGASTCWFSINSFYISIHLCVTLYFDDLVWKCNAQWWNNNKNYVYAYVPSAWHACLCLKLLVVFEEKTDIPARGSNRHTFNSNVKNKY